MLTDFILQQGFNGLLYGFVGSLFHDLKIKINYL